jgi:hypothetical protein
VTARAELVARRIDPCCQVMFHSLVEREAPRNRLPPIFWACDRCGQLWSRDGNRTTWLRATSDRLTPRQLFTHLHRMLSSRDMFETEADTIVAVLELARACSEPTDADVLKVRSFAASAGDTVSHGEALTIIAGFAARRALS